MGEGRRRQNRQQWSLPDRGRCVWLFSVMSLDVEGTHLVNLWLVQIHLVGQLNRIAEKGFADIEQELLDTVAVIGRRAKKERLLSESAHLPLERGHRHHWAKLTWHWRRSRGKAAPSFVGTRWLLA